MTWNSRMLARPRIRLLLWTCLLCLPLLPLAGLRSPLWALASTDPSIAGQWAAPISWPNVTVNTILLANGKVLTWQDGKTPTIWDPVGGTFQSVPLNSADLFCAGQAPLADGRIAVIGGYDPSSGNGITTLNIFDPATQTWTVARPMSYARWYPTGTALPDGRILAIGGSPTSTSNAPGSTYVQIPEVYDPKTGNWSRLSSASWNTPNYPNMYVLPDGRLLMTGASEINVVTETLNVASQTWTAVDPAMVSGGSSVMFQPGKFLKVGTAADSGGTGYASATAYVLDMAQPTPKWQQTGSMAYPRAFMNLTALPDGNVLVTGGGKDTSGTNLANAVLPAELWSPTTGTWTTVAALQNGRLYHSTALLLPDARVLVSGGGSDPWDAATDEKNAEIYSPPYLFKGARPAITTAPQTLQYNSSFSVTTPDAAAISSVKLIRTGAVTHAFNQSQALTDLSFQNNGGGLTLQAPANANLAPPGYYMLFLVNAGGVPSLAAMVNLPAPGADTTPPSAPGNLVAAAAATAPPSPGMLRPTTSA